MDIRSLSGKKICIAGYGREGQAMARALEEYAFGCEITIADKKSSIVAGKYFLRCGPDYLQDLKGFDVIIKSPGIPPSEFPKNVSNITNSTQIFFDSIKNSAATIIGVTGSKGKSTTSSLIHAMLKAAGKNSFLIGNIGEPAISHLKDAKLNTFFVLELSSYQLMNLNSSPNIAVVTAFFPEHLDYHTTIENYLEAKKHVARFQTLDDFVFFNAASASCKSIADESKGRKIDVSVSDAPVSLEDTKLKGTHNLENIALAWKVAERLGVSKEIAAEAIRHFTPLPHRLQSLGVKDGIEWVNDSISTTPESAIAAIDALGDRVKTIIVGGQDRGYDFAPLANRIARSSIETVILLPDSGATIGKELENIFWKGTIIFAATMSAAVDAAKTNNQKLITKNSIVLLSPASPSYGHFKNFEDRGAQFATACL